MTGSAMAALRREGFIPVSISERGEPTQHCSVSRQKLSDILRNHGNSAIIELQGLAGAPNCLVISRDLQRDYLGAKLTHVGFQRLSGKAPITAEARITLVGHSEEVHNGSCRLEQVAATILVRAEPSKLPEQIEMDISAMQMGSVLHVSALGVDPSYEVVSPADMVVAVMHAMMRTAPEPVQDATEAPK